MYIYVGACMCVHIYNTQATVMCSKMLYQYEKGKAAITHLQIVIAKYVTDTCVCVAEVLNVHHRSRVNCFAF